jgi:alpha-ribazole phosphatase
MSEILFLRHAETDMAGSFCGHSDPDLNARGRIQVAELINRLGVETIGAVYTSDLRRAYATGVAVAEAFGVDCHMRGSLREISFGQWEGLTWEEIERRDQDYACRWAAEYPNLPAPDGEDFRAFEVRVSNEVTLLAMAAENKSGNIAVVTHAGVLRTVLCRLYGCSEDDARKLTGAYCSIVRLHSSDILSTRFVAVNP